MNITKYLACAAAFMLAVGATSCSEDKEDEPSVKNRIYLTVPGGETTITTAYTDEIVVDVAFSSALAEATTFNFAFTGSNPSAMTVVDNPVAVPAGVTSHSIKVKYVGGELTDPISLELGISDLNTTVYSLEQTAKFTINPVAVIAGLTPEQTAIVEALKTNTGVDMTPWIGDVALTGTIEFPGSDYLSTIAQPQTIQLGGVTTFTLGSNADENTMSLKMASNPMGMTNYLYDLFRNVTVLDEEYFAYDDPDYSPASVTLMNLLGWNKDSQETFDVTLDNLKVVNYDPATQTGEIEFVVEDEDGQFAYDAEGNTIYVEALESDLQFGGGHTSWIPFDYKFSAWDRMLGMLSNPEIAEIIAYNTSHPASYLGIYDVTEDALEAENSLWVTPKGTIDFANGTMTFEFPFSVELQNDYSRVKVTYTLAK